MTPAGARVIIKGFKGRNVPGPREGAHRRTMKTTLGISFCVVGLYGLLSGGVLPGMLFVGAGLMLANPFRQTGSDPL